jgi:hypothetical protein
MSHSQPPTEGNKAPGPFDDSEVVIVVLEGNEDTTIRPLRPELRRLREQKSNRQQPAPPESPKPKEGNGA